MTTFIILLGIVAIIIAAFYFASETLTMNSIDKNRESWRLFANQYQEEILAAMEKGDITTRQISIADSYGVFDCIKYVVNKNIGKTGPI